MSEDGGGEGVGIVPAVLYAGGRQTEVGLRVLRHARGRRLKRAAAGLGLLWLAAAVSIFIPIAHLILVPGFFLGGIGLAVARWRRRDRFAAFEASCPVCGAPHLFDLEEAAELPRRLRCPDRDEPMILKAAT